SSVTVSDVDGDFVTDYAYAGDLRGNLWRFDLTGNNPTATRIFTATSPEGQAQPITMQPVVADHPEGKVGSVVYFGTGKY
ncbi:PilC/PilY family type IV pilus protein, partial [Klebsiella pneumoniae]